MYIKLEIVCFGTKTNKLRILTSKEMETKYHNDTTLET